ncbi:hypothetical protein Tco_0722995 [Tanacetum coccineum]
MILAEKIQQEEREQYTIEERAKFLHDTIAAQRKFLAEQRSAIIRNKPPTISQLRNQMITYLKHVANKKHAELKSKSFEEIQVLYERYKKQDQTFVAIGSEEDERAIKKINEKDADKEEEKKDESVHEEVQEEEGAKKRKLGTRRKLKAKRRKHASSLTKGEYIDLKKCLHILLMKKIDDARVLIINIHCSPNKSNGHQRFFRTLMGVLSILDREDLKVIYELVMEEYKDKLPEGFDKMLWGDLMIMFNQENRYPLAKEVLSNMLELKLETEEESSMALELIKDPILRLCHRLIALSIARRSQAPEKVTVTDLFYLRGLNVDSFNVPYLLARYLRLFTAGRKSGALICGGQFIARLAKHF